jgi:hypothetical protein
MDDDDIQVLMARLPLRMQLIVLARTWGAIEKMMAPREIDVKTRERIERMRAARKPADRGNLDF